MYEHGGNIYSNIDCIDFSANINFLGMPDQVREAVYKSIDGCVFYPDVEMRELKGALSRREDIDKDNIVCGNGAAELIFAVTAAVKPKKAMIFTPSFHEYEQAVGASGAKLVTYQLREENNFMLNPAEEDFVLKSINNEIDMVFLCNPNNPTGILTERKFIRRLLDRCEESNALLVVDECFLDFVADKGNFSVADLTDSRKNLFVLKAFTKIFAMPGLRLGYALCSDKSLLDKMQSLLQPWNVSVPAQAAGAAAANLTGFERQTRRVLEVEKTYLLKAIKSAGIKVYGYGANFIFFKAEKDFAKKMLDRKIIVRDCKNYRGLGEGYFRIAVRGHDENKIFIDSLNAVMH